MSDKLYQKRENKRIQIRREQYSKFFKLKRQDLVQSIESTQHLNINMALQNIKSQIQIEDSLDSLIKCINQSINLNQKYKNIMKIIDFGFCHHVMEIISHKNLLEKILKLISLMVSLQEKKTGKYFMKSGLFQFLVQIIKCEDIKLGSLAINIIGNISLEDINFRDLFLEIRIDQLILVKIRNRMQICPLLFMKGTADEQKRYWQLCLWLLQNLNEFEHNQQPLGVIMMIIDILDPRLDGTIVKILISILYDLEPYLGRFKQILSKKLQNLLLTCVNQPTTQYLKQLLYLIQKLCPLMFSTYKPFYFLINKNYYVQQNTSKQTKYISIIIRILFSSLQFIKHDIEIKSPFFWESILQSTKLKDQDRIYILKIFTALDIQDNDFIYRFISCLLNEHSSAHEIICALQYLHIDILKKGKDRVTEMIEKHSVEIMIEDLQKFKNDLIYQKAEQILRYFQ